MNESVDNQLLVVIVEKAALWPPWLGAYQRRVPNAAVIAQAEEESSLEFADRVSRRVAELGLGSRQVTLALLLKGHDQDRDALRARHQIGSALLIAMTPFGDGELVLVAENSLEESERERFFSLAETLCEEVRGLTLGVRVRFFEGRMPERQALHESSGVWASPQEAEDQVQTALVR